jgi:hypothetical protein
MDDDEAAHLFKLAAEQDNPHARQKLRISIGMVEAGYLSQDMSML